MDIRISFLNHFLDLFIFVAKERIHLEHISTSLLQTFLISGPIFLLKTIKLVEIFSNICLPCKHLETTETKII